MKNFFDWWSKKTYKREMSVVLLVILVYTILEGDTEMVEAIIWPFLSFIATSVGIHIYDRTTSNRREVMEVVE